MSPLDDDHAGLGPLAVAAIQPDHVHVPVGLGAPGVADVAEVDGLLVTDQKQVRLAVVLQDDLGLLHVVQQQPHEQIRVAGRTRRAAERFHATQQIVTGQALLLGNRGARHDRRHRQGVRLEQ